MDAFALYLNDLMNKSRHEFAGFNDINWLNYYRDLSLIEERNCLVEEYSKHALFKKTKPFYNTISPGCEICGAGKWSCLFITNKCNANCFYCPAEQKYDEIPSTQSLDFESAEMYADYVNTFGFKGVSFSGGEPLLFFDRTLEYLKAVRQRLPDIYIWMYTNGILADADKMQKLADAGLNEIRFDIGAIDYSIEKIKAAKDIIPNITIEIPAVPEKTERIIKLLPDMIEVGVTNLNLHQLRLTNYNAPKLLKHNYTYIGYERPIVLESEIAALKILNHAKKHHLPIGINYCSFAFKNRFQKAGFRKILADAINIPQNQLTENGFVREITDEFLTYKNLSISREFSKNAVLVETGLQKFYVKIEQSGQRIKLSEEIKSFLNNIALDQEIPMPQELRLFEIYRKEFIESGLREL
ncbi:MAG: radical SAM protein [Bacteroidales bacterium]|nr:radical SAM protein [Bacteroidales bacterium]